MARSVRDAALIAPRGPRTAKLRAVQPQLFEAIGDNYAGLASLLDPVTVELCRLRVAQLLDDQEQLSVRSAEALAAGLSEADVRALRDWRESSRFDPARRAGLAFAEQFCSSAQSVSEEDVAALCEYLAPDQVVALTARVGLAERFQRLCQFLDVNSEVA